MKKDETLSAMTRAQKLQHFRDGIFKAIAQAAKVGRGQPPMVDRFREVTIMADALETRGIPFGVGRNSRMNKEVRNFLNDTAEQSLDRRKSRVKKIADGAVRALLRKVRWLRVLGDHFINLPPYAE